MSFLKRQGHTEKVYTLTITASGKAHPTPQELVEAICTAVEDKKNNTETGEHIPGSYEVDIKIVN